MSVPLTLTHVHGDRLTVTADGTDLLTYVHRPDPEAFESRKPYAHPVRTLGGRLVTGYRPNDHRWHKGIQMTASHLTHQLPDGDVHQNFWGGNSYIHPHGYQPLHDHVGRMRHDAFSRADADGDRVTLAEELTWLSHPGEEWAREERTLTVHSADPAAGAWALDWAIRLTSTADGPLRFGSPTTAGRRMAGYTGLHWRGPRDFTGGTVLTSAGRASDADTMGTPAADAPWLAFTGEHDDTDGYSTLVFAHAPENLGESAVHPSHWFVRSSPTPTVSFSWAFFEEFALLPGESFAFRYRVVVADGVWDAAGTEQYLARIPW